MKNVTKEIIDNSTNSPRLSKFKEYLDKWMEDYIKTDDPGIDMIILGYDRKYKHNIKFSLTTKQNIMRDLFNAINKGLGNVNDSVSRDIFNVMCQYIANVMVEYPEIEKLFVKNVMRMKANKGK